MTLVQDNSVQAINTALLSIKRDISAPTTTTAGTTAGLEPGKTYNINISGNAETATTAKTARTATNANHAETATNANHAETAETATNANHAETATTAETVGTAETANKVANALTVNGKTYNGSEAVDAGVQAVEYGGTGATTAEGAANLLIASLPASDNVPVDTDYFISQVVNGGPFVPGYQRRPISKLWEYIKGKISSVLGLTKDNYGGKAAKSSFLDEYVGAGGTRPTSGNIAPKDSSEYGGMRKDVVTSSMTDSGHPGQDGHLLTMFWDNSGRYDSQLFVSNENPPTLKARAKANGTDYGPWVDVITGNNAGSKLILQGSTVSSNSYTDTNPKLVFNNIDGSQSISLTFTDFDAVQAPASLTLNGNQGNEYFIAPCIKANNKMRIPIGAPSSLEDGCIWIER